MRKPTPTSLGRIRRARGLLTTGCAAVSSRCEHRSTSLMSRL
jgi:hypothetical protein